MHELRIDDCLYCHVNWFRVGEQWLEVRVLDDINRLKGKNDRPIGFAFEMDVD